MILVKVRMVVILLSLAAPRTGPIRSYPFTMMCCSIFAKLLSGIPAPHGRKGTPAHPFAPSTDSEIEFGTGLVFSKMPSSGRMTRKNAK